MEMSELPTPGDILTNAQLMEDFAIGMMGGMRRSKKNNLLVLVSDYTKGLYEDHWEGDVLHYTGMGKVGDQTLSSQNKTLAESLQTDIEVHLLEVFKPTEYTYVGKVHLASEPYKEQQQDDNGNMRSVYMFPVTPSDASHIPEPKPETLHQLEGNREKTLRKKSIAELKALAQSSSGKTNRRKVEGEQIVRNSAVTTYVKKAANGLCDLCENDAPLKRTVSPI